MWVLLTFGTYVLLTLALLGQSQNAQLQEGLHISENNDLWGTDMTFGFQSAVDIATDTIDRIHTTATSHSRVFIIEVMGHKVGWVTLHAGIAGGADIILLPEIRRSHMILKDNVECDRSNRTEAGKHLRSSRLQKARSQRRCSPSEKN